jgi:hypothetical protein
MRRLGGGKAADERGGKAEREASASACGGKAADQRGGKAHAITPPRFPTKRQDAASTSGTTPLNAASAKLGARSFRKRMRRQGGG